VHRLAADGLKIERCVLGYVSENGQPYALIGNPEERHRLIADGLKIERCVLGYVSENGQPYALIGAFLVLFGC
jgi:hypothetical protein